VVLGDSGVVMLALPEILREFGAAVGGVGWVLIAFNLVLALVAVPAARVCVRGDPAVATAGGVIGFAAATTVCAVAPSLGVLIAARAAQAAGGAVAIVEASSCWLPPPGTSARAWAGGPRLASPARHSARWSGAF
jgi:MFS family permease